MKSKVKIALAPMAGVTDSSFRLLNVFGGADLTYSEMAHVVALSHRGKKTLDLIKASPFEFPYVVQLFGNDPDSFGKAAEIVSREGVPTVNYKKIKGQKRDFLEKLFELLAKEEKWPVFESFRENFERFQNELETKIPERIIPSGLDINFGCPAKKVFGHGSGAKLFSDINRMKKIVKSVCQNSKIPVSIKLRTSVKDVSVFSVLEELSEFPIKRVMIHGRSYEEGFSGKPNFSLLKKAKEQFGKKFEIFVNGGIEDKETGKEMEKKTGCSNLAIARGAFGNPFLSQIIKNNEKKDLLELNEKTKIIIFAIISYLHFLLNTQSKGKRGVFEMRKYLAWYFRGFEGAVKLRSRLVEVKELKELEEIIEEIVSF